MQAPDYKIDDIFGFEFTYIYTRKPMVTGTLQQGEMDALTYRIAKEKKIDCNWYQLEDAYHGSKCKHWKEGVAGALL